LAEGTRGLSLKLIHGDVVGVFAYDGLGDFPDLDQVVFGGAADDPGFGLVPAEIGEVVGVAAVHEEPV